MGGHAGGGTASRLAVETIRKAMQRAREEDPALFGSGAEGEENPLPDILGHAVEEACAAIFQAAQADTELSGMGTTVTAVLVDGRSAFVAHVGDSRAYLLRSGHIYQVTQDHSLVAEQLRSGVITEEDARTSRYKNIITRSVGFEREVLVDLMGLELEAGDAVVACSDGLSNHVDDQEILAMVEEQGEVAVERLVDLANDRGGEDNITVALVRLADPLPEVGQEATGTSAADGGEAGASA
jgi:protein phosphatase